MTSPTDEQQAEAVVDGLAQPQQFRCPSCDAWASMRWFASDTVRCDECGATYTTSHLRRLWSFGK